MRVRWTVSYTGKTGPRSATACIIPERRGGSEVSAGPFLFKPCARTLLGLLRLGGLRRGGRSYRDRSDRVS